MNITDLSSIAFPAYFQVGVVYRCLGFIGLLSNSFTLYLLSHKNMIHPMYAFLWCRTFCNLIVCLFACGWVHPLAIDEPDTYANKFYMLYVIAIPTRIAFFASAISDIILILNRFFIITERNVLNISKKTNLSICYAIPAFLVFAYCFVHEIVESDEVKGMYVCRLTSFGKSRSIVVYMTVVFTLETFVPVMTLGVLNTISVQVFRQKMINKGMYFKK